MQNVVRRDEAFWLTESDWCFKKVFHTVFDVLVTSSFSVSNSVCFWRKRKCFTLLSQSAAFFFPSRYHICDQFLWPCPQKNICIANWLLLSVKKKTQKWKLKEDEIIGGKKESYFRRLFGPLHGKIGNFEGVVYQVLSLFGQWNQSKEFSKQLSFGGSKVHPLKRNIEVWQRICFLFVDWANWKFFFFVEEMFRVSIVFSCL